MILSKVLVVDEFNRHGPQSKTGLEHLCVSHLVYRRTGATLCCAYLVYSHHSPIVPASETISLVRQRNRYHQHKSRKESSHENFQSSRNIVYGTHCVLHRVKAAAVGEAAIVRQRPRTRFFFAYSSTPNSSRVVKLQCEYISDNTFDTAKSN